MYAQRRVREEAPIVQQVPKSVPREHPLSSATSLRKTLSIQNLSQIETPWEGVTLNRCLLLVITILLLSCTLQRINEALRGHKEVSEDFVTLAERQTLIKRERATSHEPEISLWDTLFWWVADDDDEGKSKRATRERVSRSLRHRALPDPKLLKKREMNFSQRRGRGRRDTDETKDRLKRKKEKEMKVQKKEEKDEEEKPKERKHKSIKKQLEL
ncbi:uncharacterized protein LOC127645814 isoform X2 [Xyrauchen texanus]|nr:uncharacterized protein LOC127645814 isoform X2 [Xyrauchen texanus]XP_051985455.1 uncharacterized protein LOC127645814 isoform X2 [Xyrauchen texanus]XP_051985456.1 uncharacterized protein LOC127645814 isoform X2 [Xyrauchen texanus]XP_051985457.1 uncharacterized protein LOC127645814 isoform X2 [Xyrauchen texanus]